MFASQFLLEMALPFILVFVLIFAILEKSKLFGENKHQINSLIGLCMAFLLIAFPTPRDVVVSILPWLAVGLSVLLVFFILYGFIEGDLSKGLPKGLKISLSVLAGLFVVGVVLFATGIDKKIPGWISSSSNLIGNILTLLVIVGLIFWVIIGSKKKTS